MKTNDADDRQDYRSVIFSGCAIESTNGVSICNLNDYLQRSVRGANYQVWSDKHRTHELYHSLDDAVDKFLELKNRGY
jgi:hypothetical protein